MPTEGTGLSTLSEDKPMAQVTYRGVKYDSEAYRQMVQAEAQKRNHDLMYRGIKVERKFASKSWPKITFGLHESGKFFSQIFLCPESYKYLVTPQ